MKYLERGVRNLKKQPSIAAQLACYGESGFVDDFVPSEELGPVLADLAKAMVLDAFGEDSWRKMLREAYRDHIKHDIAKEKA